MTKYHKDLSEEKWFDMTMAEQMANVGSEVGRAIRWKGQSQNDFKLSFYRALELLQLTIADPKNRHGLKELTRAKEMLVDWFLGNPLYNSTDEEWESYFLQFNLLARKDR